IQDMLFLVVQHKLFHLNDSDIVDFIVLLWRAILAIEDTWERERSGFAEEKVWGDIPVVTGFWGGKEDFLGELAVWSPEDV
ncbi:hypothetical protein Tco_1171782, partial [Tanacetum coccineum]